MKSVLPHLTLNQKVWALVEEVSEDGLIVNFQGDLIRVENQSGRVFRPGQRIQLLVTAVLPLGFKLLEFRHERKAISGLDISV